MGKEYVQLCASDILESPEGLLEENKRMFGDNLWLFQEKFDGERLTLYTGAKPKVINRHNNDVTAAYPDIAALAAGLPQDSVFDGEGYCPGMANRPGIQTTAGRSNVKNNVALRARMQPAVFMAFDCIKLAGVDISSKAFADRFHALNMVSMGAPAGFNVVPLVGYGEVMKVWADILKDPTREGMVAKRASAPYAFERNANWRKIKKFREYPPLDVIGYTSNKREVSALILEGGFKVNAKSPEIQARVVAHAREFPVAVKVKANDGEEGVPIPPGLQVVIEALDKSATGYRQPRIVRLIG